MMGVLVGNPTKTLFILFIYIGDINHGITGHYRHGILDVQCDLRKAYLRALEVRAEIEGVKL